MEHSKELILSLLRADLKNSKLLYGLEKVGFTADDFYTDLDRQVLELMGFGREQRSDELYQHYHQTIERLVEVPLPVFFENLKTMTLELYNELLQYKVGLIDGKASR